MRLFWKLFGLQVLAVTAVLAGALLLTRAYSVQGFVEFLETRNREQVEQLATQLGEAVDDGARLGEAWDAQLPKRRERRQRPPPQPQPQSAPGPVLPGPAQPGAHHEGRIVVRRHIVRPPLQLQDAAGNYLRGDPGQVPDDAQREPVEVDGRVVGYLVWMKPPRHPEEAEFAHKQFVHILRIAPIALLVSALFAALITALIVRPIRVLSGGAAALARREFATRLPEDRGDELGALATDFNRLAAALQGYDSRQRQWLADISHELRTPVAVLRGELEALLDGVRTADDGAMRSLRQEVGRLEALINDLQLVALAEAGALRLARVPTDLAELAGRAAERFRERLKARGFSIVLDAPAGARVEIDVQRMEQVVANLLENAVRHANPPGPVTIAVRAAADAVSLSVADTGPGVPADALPRLFDRLYRVEVARTRATGGAGLGLSISQSIVEAHGGTIRARPSAAGGLEVVITLPPGPA